MRNYRYVTPGRIFGPIWFAGIHEASTHLIETGDGLILIDPGYPDTLQVILDNMEKIGLDYRDIKIILLSHGHHDHAGAVRKLVDLTGAKTYVGKDDLKMVTCQDDSALSPMPDYREKCAFTPDVLLSDGDTVSLGNITVLCLSTPGHTDGTMSFFFDVSDGNRTFRAGMHGGVGLNTLKREFLESHNLPLTNRDKFISGLQHAKSQQVDIVLGNHVGQNDTEGKLARVARGETDAFVDSEEWLRFLDGRIRAVKELE